MTKNATGSDLPEGSMLADVWRGNGIKESTIQVYLRWVNIFCTDCIRRGHTPISELDHGSVLRFARRYARKRGIASSGAEHGARSALHAWSCSLSMMGWAVPRWKLVPERKRSRGKLITEFREFRQEHCGITDSGIRRETGDIAAFLAWLRSRSTPYSQVNLLDIDTYVLVLRKRLARKTVSRACCSIRAFLRFLQQTGRIRSDLASSVVAPLVRRGEQPPRALPWKSVQRILHAIDRKTAVGKRDYAILLMMATYGMGAAEVTGLALKDINWTAETIRVVRRKTGVEFLLPLLPEVGHALAAYLRFGRPRHTPFHFLFVQVKTPFGPLTTSSAVRHILVKHARAAGIRHSFGGSHILRHSHAARQIEQGSRPEVLGDILGHRRPESTSVYVRIATKRLRSVSLPIPR